VKVRRSLKRREGTKKGKSKYQTLSNKLSVRTRRGNGKQRNINSLIVTQVPLRGERVVLFTKEGQGEKKKRP